MTCRLFRWLVGLSHACCHLAYPYTTFDYCRVVADILLPLLSTVKRDFVAIIVRVNPTTERKVMACSRFDTPPSCTVDNASFLVAVNALTLFLFARIDSQLRNANPRDFSRLFIGRTAVVGWPLNKRFTKIGDNLDAVLALACAVVDSPDFLARDAVFCPGGRGKFCPLNGTYTARLTIYLGARYNIQMAMHMQSQPFTRFFLFCSVATCVFTLSRYVVDAWRCCDFVLAFEDALGMPFERLLHLCQDISRWDASFLRAFLGAIGGLHVALLRALGAPARYVAFYIFMYKVIGNGVVIFGPGYLVTFLRGIKSGTSLTAVDNTLIHIIIVAILLHSERDSERTKQEYSVCRTNASNCSFLHLSLLQLSSYLGRSNTIVWLCCVVFENTVFNDDFFKYRFLRRCRW